MLFRSAAECAGRDALAIILTCVVFGMPKEAIALGCVDEVMLIQQVARAISAFDVRG